MHEIDLDGVGGFQRLVLLDQRALDVHGVADVLEGNERGAVGQRHGGQVDHHAVAPLDARDDRLALVDRGHRGAQVSPHRIVVVQRLRPGGHRLHVRMLVERLGRELPHALERRIVQPHAAVRAEHRDRFGQVIERLALHLDQRVVAAVHVEPLGDVVIQISDAAFRIGRGDHAQRAAVRQVPHMLLRLDRAIGLVQLLLPLPEVLLLGQLALGAQACRARPIGRRLVEQAGVEFEQRAEGGVVEDQLAVGVEDGDAGGELVEHAAVRLDHAREFGAHGLHLGGVDRHAGAAGAARRVHHVEDAALAGDDGRQPSE